MWRSVPASLAERSVTHPPSASRYLLFKRLLDMGLALVLLALFSPLMLLIAAGIKLTSPGPVFFRQTRVGKDGKLFDMLKFRTMRDGVDCGLHREHVSRLMREATAPKDKVNGSLKLKNDPRITALGRIVRRTSLDELPQFFNVLRGDMSLVGPRPPIPYELECYQPWHHRRFQALPGITGFWQVAGRNRVCFDEMVQMDLYYIKHQCLRLDAWILLKTPFEMLSGKGAG